MNNCDKYLIQYMLQHGCVKSDKVLQFCRKVSDDTIRSHDNLKDLIADINEQIKKQHFKIALTKCEVTEDNVIVWLNTKKDKISKLQSSFSALELEYFNSILQEVINSEYRKLKFTVCLNISSTLTDSFSKDAGQKVLYTWINGGYFVKNGEYLHLGPRTLLEFSSYLCKTNRDCICILCVEIVFTGKICSICNKISHSYCLTRYQKNHNTCPNCNNDWKEAECFNWDVTNGLPMDSVSEDESQPSQNTQEKRKSRKRTRPGPSTARSDNSDED